MTPCFYITISKLKDSSSERFESANLVRFFSWLYVCFDDEGVLWRKCGALFGGVGVTHVSVEYGSGNCISFGVAMTCVTLVSFHVLRKR